MKCLWKKLKGLALSQHQIHNRDDKRDLLHRRPCLKLSDDFTQACKELHDMKTYNDSMVYAAAVAANSASEFCVALGEIGTCLLEQSALTGDEQSGNVLRMLSKVQFEIQELVDSYCATALSESILNQVQTLEGMQETKHQCDEKRSVYQGLLAAQRKMEKPRFFKSETNSPQQLQAAFSEYEREVSFFVSRLKSLKEGQTRSLLTQAVQHHAAQNNLFSKGLKSLEAIDLEVRSVAEHLRINDHNSRGLDKERCVRLSRACNNLQYTSPLELEKNEINSRGDKPKKSQSHRSPNKFKFPSSSAKLGELRDIPSPPSARNERFMRQVKVRHGQNLGLTNPLKLNPGSATDEYRLTQSKAAAHTLPLPPETVHSRGHCMPLSDARFYHSAPMGRTSDHYTKNKALSTPPIAPMYSKNGCQSRHYVPTGDERLYHCIKSEKSEGYRLCSRK